MNSNRRVVQSRDAGECAFAAGYFCIVGEGGGSDPGVVFAAALGKAGLHCGGFVGDGSRERDDSEAREECFYVLVVLKTFGELTECDDADANGRVGLSVKCGAGGADAVGR